MEEELREKFKKYTDNFDKTDLKIMMKHYHSYRVMSLATLIADYADFEKEDYDIARVAALLHDYARFPQWQKYKTYVDKESVDHGDLGVELLFEEGEIKNFWTKEEDYDEIYDVIKYHNKYLIPEHLNERHKKLLKIIRDADKLDILYLIGNKDIELDECAEPISPKVRETFMNRKAINYDDIQNENDKIVARFAFVFDFNYTYSFKHLHDYKTYEKIYDNIENKQRFEYYFNKTKEYILEKINEGNDKNA